MRAAAVLLFAAPAGATRPAVPLLNAAKPGSVMPMTGIGTGGYGGPKGFGKCPNCEYWNDTMGHDAVKQWLALGKDSDDVVRIDASLTYGSSDGVGMAIKEAMDAGMKREQFFITSKVGPNDPRGTCGLAAGEIPDSACRWGYDPVIEMADLVVKSLQVDYVDLLLVHWPGQHLNGNFSNQPCYDGNFTNCRLQTWRALQKVLADGKTRAIGVSNYEAFHIQEIIDLRKTEPDTLLPAVNQVEMSPYWKEPSLMAFCRAHNILFNGYSSCGCPDYSSRTDRWGEDAQLIRHPMVTALATKYNKSPCQVLLRWSLDQGVVVNPRTNKPAHMQENLDVFDFALTPSEIAQLATLKPPTTPPGTCQGMDYDKNVCVKVTDDPRDII